MSASPFFRWPTTSSLPPRRRCSSRPSKARLSSVRCETISDRLIEREMASAKGAKAAMPFPILTDVDNGYALSLNLAIFFGLEMQKFIKEGASDIAPYQGNDAWILPIPATFVVGRDSIIRARFVEPDARKRMAIDVIVDALRAC